MSELLSEGNLLHWISVTGYIGLACIVLLETGFFFGFFLPGDSLVFTAGLLASRGIFNIWILMLILTVTAFIGYFIGYWVGDKLGTNWPI